MKLIRLKLLSEFRGLDKGFEIIFDDTKNVNNALFEPICFVGLNGSGKSNILEVISEIFYFLENFSRSTSTKRKEFETDFGFEIEYVLPKNIYNKKLAFEQPSADADIQIKIVKKPKKSPVAETIPNNRKEPYFTPDEFISFLPNYIVAYSSGMNELISNPYIKMDFQYLQDFRKLTMEDPSDIVLEPNKLFFMDYDLNKLITICNFLFDTKIADDDAYVKNIQPIKEKIRIENLYSFTIEIRLRKENKQPIALPLRLRTALKKLELCATLSNKKIGKTAKWGEYEEYTYSYLVDKEVKSAFKDQFISAYRLFSDLYFLRLLNNYLVGGDTQRNVLKAGLGANISEMLPKYESRKKLFYISDIAFIKEKSKNPVFYNQLSDGEHQFLHVIGTMILLDSEGILFLLDEPETHFNPEWRSQFVSILNECTRKETNHRKQELLLTTHSPFIVSDCKKQRVFIFKRKDKNNKVKIPKNPENETYGRSIEMIYWEIFGKHETISKMALNELTNIKNKIINRKISKKEAIKALLNFGNSMERMQIVKLLKEWED